MMIKLKRTGSDDKDFISLVEKLDDELKIRDGDEHLFYARYNKIDKIKFAIVAYENDVPAGCGALKEMNGKTIEIKRMFVLLQHRKKGIATKVLSELEIWAKELGFSKCILETGKMQPEAIGLYKKHGYYLIPNYGQYKGKDRSVCFEKKLSSQK